MLLKISLIGEFRHMKKKLIAIILCTILVFCFGCNTKNKVDEGKTKIVTSFYPIYIFTINLTQGIKDVTVQNITQQTGGCIHDYQLLPKDMVLLDDAALFVTNGAGMETFVSKVSEQLPNLPVVSSSDGIALMESGHPHHDEDAQEASNEHEHTYNGHVWLSVSNAIIQVENISKALKKTLPDDADKIEKNKKEYIKRLTSLDKQIENELKDYSGTPIMTFHEAYNYFATDYNLLIIATIENDEGNEPSAKEIAKLSSTIKEFDVPAVFIEPDYAGSSAKILASETGIKVCTLNPITSGNASLTAYEDIMKSNLSVIKEALG